MHMSRRIHLAAEHGYSMMAVMLVLLATSMIAGAAFAAVGGDIPFARAAQDRKQAYAAAEAGIDYYLYQLTRDNDFWKFCDDTEEPTPINQPDPDPGARKWRNVSGADARYSIELLPANDELECDPDRSEETLLDKGTGSFRVRVTGESRGERRSIVTTFRRTSFLDYLYFTKYETLDPQAYSSAEDRTRAAAECEKYRAERTSFCSEITFPDWDEINGPLHTNDDLLVCGTPVFGRTPLDEIEISGPQANGWQDNSCSAAPEFKGTKRHRAPYLEVPTSNDRLKTVADYVFTGQTTIVFDGENSMDVLTHNASGVASWEYNKALPENGVIYVDENTSGGGCGTIDPPRSTNYDASWRCAILTVRGEYPKSMTLGSKSDILIDDDLVRDPAKDIVLGLIAENFVRIKHPVSGSNCSNNASGTNTNITVEAAILTLDHSFIVDNYPCGPPLGNLTVTGAIAQKFRGPVGTFSGSTRTHGYEKNYNYDDRLRYRNPPYFLDPVAAAWRTVRNNEQVPAAE
jgi:hypothetical protein